MCGYYQVKVSRLSFENAKKYHIFRIDKCVSTKDLRNVIITYSFFFVFLQKDAPNLVLAVNDVTKYLYPLTHSCIVQSTYFFKVK